MDHILRRGSLNAEDRGLKIHEIEPAIETTALMRKNLLSLMARKRFSTSSFLSRKTSFKRPSVLSTSKE